MITLLSFSFWIYFIYFLVAIFLAFYIPGVFFISRLKLTKFQETVISFLLGMVLWGWQGFIFGYLNIRWFSYIYLFGLLLFWLKINYKKIGRLKEIRSLIKGITLDYILIFLIVAGLLTQLSSVWFNGLLTPGGLYFCCGTIPDNILHIAITDQVVKNFPPFEPGMYGTYIQNYHYWSSLVTGELIRVFKLPLIPTDYQYMTVFISLFLGFSAIVFSQLLKLGKVFTRWLLFFLYFGGDFVWLLILFLRGNQIFNMQPMESGQQFLENIPRATAVIVFFTALSIFLIWIKKKDLRTGLTLALLVSALVGFKIYIGLFAIFGFVALFIYYFFQKKYELLIPIIFTVLFSFILYFPVNSHAGGFYFTGAWRFENFIMQGYFGNLSSLELARTIYLAHNNIPRIIEYESIYLLLFIFATFGTKLLGVLQSKKSLSYFPKELHLLFIPGFIISFILGSFFGQTSGGSNTFNFLVSIFILGSIYTALATFHWLNKASILRILLAFILISLTLPRGLNQTYRNVVNIYNNAGFIVGNDELRAIAYLSKQKGQSLVLVDPKISMDKESPYISFLSNKKMFLSGQGDELTAHNIDFSERLNALDTILYSSSPSLVSAALLKYNIDYLFMTSSTNFVSTDSGKFLENVFENSKIKVLKVNKDVIRKFK